MTSSLKRILNIKLSIYKCVEIHLADGSSFSVGSYEEAEKHNQLPLAETGKEHEEALTAVGILHNMK